VDDRASTLDRWTGIACKAGPCTVASAASSLGPSTSACSRMRLPSSVVARSKVGGRPLHACLSGSCRLRPAPVTRRRPTVPGWWTGHPTLQRALARHGICLRLLAERLLGPALVRCSRALCHRDADHDLRTRALVGNDAGSRTRRAGVRARGPRFDHDRPRGRGQLGERPRFFLDRQGHRPVTVGLRSSCGPPILGHNDLDEEDVRRTSEGALVGARSRRAARAEDRHSPAWQAGGGRRSSHRGRTRAEAGCDDTRAGASRLRELRASRGPHQRCRRRAQGRSPLSTYVLDASVAISALRASDVNHARAAKAPAHA
jgi:hypothetical protein